jgi:hypothetical protein
LDHSELAYRGAYGGIPKDCYPRYGWRDFLDQLQPFATQAVFELHEARCVSARLRQAFDEAGADRVRNDDKDDRHRARFLQQELCSEAASGQNDVRGKCDQFRCVFTTATRIPLAKTRIDLNVEAVYPA